MKKLFAYLDKNKIEYKPGKITNRYFDNVAPVEFDAVQITMWYGSQNYQDQKAGYDKAVKYCNRYGYTIINAWHTNTYDTIIIMTAAEAAAYKIYYDFAEASITECDNIIHEYKKAGRDNEINYTLYKIMEKFGNELKAATAAACTA